MTLQRHLPSYALTLLLSAYSLALPAQVELPTQWVKTYSSPVGGNAQSWGVEVDANGHIYYPASIDSMGQGYDIVCYKYDTDGVMLWDEPLYYGGPGAQQAYVCIEEGEEFYIGGRVCPFSGFSCDMLLLKVDKLTGDTLWTAEQDFGNNGYDEVDGLSIESDGIYCGGWGQAIQTGIYQNDMGLWKLDHDGTTLWMNHLGVPETSEHLDGHFVLDDDYIYAAGLWGGTNWILNLNNGHSFLGKFSREDGSLVDSVLFGSQSDAPLDIDNALGMTSDGEFLYLTGYTILPGETDWQVFIAKYDYDLNQIWYEDFGGTGTETARGIVTHGDRIYIAGTTESDELMTGGAQDALLIEYDKNGTYLSQYTWGGALKDAFRDIVIHEGSIYLPGASTPTAQGSLDSLAFLVKADLSLVAGVDDLDPEEPMTLRLFQDANTGRLTIHPPRAVATSRLIGVSITDMSGRRMMASSHPGATYFGLDISDLPAGAYILSLQTELHRLSKAFVK